MSTMSIANKMQRPGSTKPLTCTFQAYEVRTWSPLDIQKIDAPCKVVVSKLETFLSAENKSIFTYNLLIADQKCTDEIQSFTWNLFFYACQALVNFSEDPSRKLSDFYALLRVIEEFFRKEANNSESDLFLLGLSTYYLALCNQHGIGCEPNEQKSLHYFKTATKFGISPAASALGLTYEFGLQHTSIDKKALKDQYLFAEMITDRHPLSDHMSQSPKESIHYYKQKARRNDPDSQCILAISYYLGDGVKKSPQHAFEYFKKAAKLGHPMAQYHVACTYEEGVVCVKDPKKAMYYFMLSSNQGYPKAQYRLGIHYQDNEDTFEKAFHYVKKAADNGYKEAQYKIATFYESGAHGKKNAVKAKHYYVLAAKQGCAKAQNNLGHLYYTHKRFQNHFEKAFQLFQMSASRHYLFGHRNLGFCYQHGKGTQKNLLKAIDHYKEYERLDPVGSEAEGLSYQCIAELAMTYQIGGDGIEKNMKKAFKLFNDLTTKAPRYSDSRKVYRHVCLLLGSLYHKGNVDRDLILSVDLKKAIDLYKEAELYEPLAMFHLAQFARAGLVWKGEVLVQRNLMDYQSKLKKVADKGLPEACFELATHYEKGLKGPSHHFVIQKNLKKAIAFYRKATGIEEAHHRLGQLMSDRTDRVD